MPKSCRACQLRMYWSLPSWTLRLSIEACASSTCRTTWYSREGGREGEREGGREGEIEKVSSSAYAVT